MDESLFPPTISKKVGKRENSWSVQRERRELVGYSGHNRKSNDDWPHNQFFSVASYKTNQIEGSLVAANPLNDFGCDRNGVIVIDCELAQFFFRRKSFRFWAEEVDGLASAIWSSSSCSCCCSMIPISFLPCVCVLLLPTKTNRPKKKLVAQTTRTNFSRINFKKKTYCQRAESEENRVEHTVSRFDAQLNRYLSSFLFLSFSLFFFTENAQHSPNCS